MFDGARLRLARAIAPTATPTGQPVTDAVLTSPLPPAVYEPHEDDPAALLRSCPACLAPIGAWCGGKGDIHLERRQP